MSVKIIDGGRTLEALRSDIHSASVVIAPATMGTTKASELEDELDAMFAKKMTEIWVLKCRCSGHKKGRIESKSKRKIKQERGTAIRNGRRLEYNPRKKPCRLYARGKKLVTQPHQKEETV